MLIHDTYSYVIFVFVQNKIYSKREENARKDNVYVELKESALPSIHSINHNPA